MSTLSKVFVIITLLMSIAYCVAAAFLYAYTQDYKKKYEKEKAAHEETKRLKDQEIASLKSTIQNNNTKIAALEDEVNKVKRDNENLRGDKRRLEQDKANLQMQVNKLMAENKTLADLNKDLNEQLKLAKKRIGEQEAKIADLENKKAALTREVTSLADMNERLGKRIVALRKELHSSEQRRRELENVFTKLEEMGFDIPAIIVKQGTVPVHGKVLAVDPETDIVVISVGEKAHVTKGMSLSVYRGDNYVGKVVVNSVFPDMSSARIIRAETVKEVKAGDNVTNRF